MLTFTPSKPCEPAQPISLYKCPVFLTNVLFFNFLLWSRVMVLVEETKTSNSGKTISIWTPSQHSCRAQKGPHSANRIRRPEPRRHTN